MAVAEGVRFEKDPVALIQDKFGSLPSKDVEGFRVYHLKPSNYPDSVFVVDIARAQVVSFTTAGMTEAEITAKTARVIGKYQAYLASDVTLDKLDTGKKTIFLIPAEKYPSTYEGFMQWQKDQNSAQQQGAVK